MVAVPSKCRHVGVAGVANPSQVCAPLFACTPVPWSSARVRKREDDNHVADDLIGQRERKPREHGDAPVSAMLPLRRCVRQLSNQLKRRVDFIFELGAQPGLTRLVVMTSWSISSTARRCNRSFIV